MQPPSFTFQRRPSPLQFEQEENILGHSIESLLICFENHQGVPYSQRQIRSKMINTLMIIYAYTLQKCLPSLSSLARNRIYLGTDLKEKLTDLFCKLPGYCLFPYRQSRQKMVNTLLMVNIKPICKR